MKSIIPFKCPYNDFSCIVMEDWTVEPDINCTDCPHKKHKWSVEEGISPNTDIYKFANGLRLVHIKDIKRAYIQSRNPHVYFESINTLSLTKTEWEQTLIGISKL